MLLLFLPPRLWVFLWQAVGAEIRAVLRAKHSPTSFLLLLRDAQGYQDITATTALLLPLQNSVDFAHIEDYVQGTA